MKRLIAAIRLVALLVVSLCSCAMGKLDSLGNVLLLGDSFSTFEGSIPEGYACFYKNTGYGGVTSEEHTWWHRLITMTGSHLLLNSSYSGSTICHTGYSGEDYSDISFITRLRELISDGFFERNSVDTFIVYGGLNDYWASAPRGEIKYDGITEADLYSVYPALSLIFSLVREASPDTRIIFIIEDMLDDDMSGTIKEIAAHYGVDTIEPRDIEMQDSHPNYNGMKSLAEQIVVALREMKK